MLAEVGVVANVPPALWERERRPAAPGPRGPPPRATAT